MSAVDQGGQAAVLLELAALCRSEDRDVDQAIDQAIGNVCADGWAHLVPEYTRSLDAAMTLVPYDMGANVSRHGKRNEDCSAYVGKSDSDARGNFMTGTSAGEAKTMALALCIAALKARAKRLVPPATHKRKRKKAAQATPNPLSLETGT
jgi:hypothetical protein